MATQAGREVEIGRQNVAGEGIKEGLHLGTDAKASAELLPRLSVGNWIWRAASHARAKGSTPGEPITPAALQRLNGQRGR